MKLTRLLALAVVSLLFSSCASIIGSVARPDNLTPEQIRAYNEAGFDIYGCFNLTGPPPSGGLTYFVVPKGKPMSVSWANNCQPMNAGIK